MNIIVLAAGLMLADSASARDAPDRVMVRFRPGAPAAAIQRVLDDESTGVVRELPAIRFRVLALPPGRTVPEALGRLRRNPNVEVAEPDLLLHASALPNDPARPLQWALERIGANLAWSLTIVGAKGSSAVVIAIVDSGLRLSQTDLAPKLVPGTNVVSPLLAPDDDFGHGSAVAGVAAAATDNGTGIAGVAWLARIMPVKVLDFNGEGTESAILQGVLWAVDHGAKVINLSLGSCDTSGDCGSPSVAGAETMEAAHAAGAVIVAASGNEGKLATSWPAGYPYVIGVAATGPDDARTPYSNYGTAVDIAAPGGNGCSAGTGILSPCAVQWLASPSCCGGFPSCPCSGPANDAYDPVSGTSLATPVVSGIAAVLLGQDPTRTPDDVTTLIERTADHPDGATSWNQYLGYGRANLHRALTGAGLPPPGGKKEDIGYVYPNPFSPPLDGYVTFIFRGTPAFPVTVEVFDAAGNVVRTLNAPPGADLYYNSPVRWDGRDDRGQDMAGGVYTARLKAGSSSSIKRIVLAR